MSAGCFITLEGGEGAGKTTQQRLLVEAIRLTGREAVATREPGGAPAAEAIRALLVTGAADRWHPLTETLLHVAARHEHVVRTIRPALERGAIVVCDRFFDSTMAYQGYGQGVARETIEAIHATVLGTLSPDLTVILDIPVEVGLARAAHRGDGRTRYEAMTPDFHQRLRDGFLDIARREPGRCVVVDATRPPEFVHRDVRKAASARLRIAGL
ncbi:MAG: dTMP kinase [Candidatus Sericytochromatia bacterium]|uniref:Thymidylate kinase n=1 Tax=Candidatus Tanganyikabacteria bacterium TaxID=2961651 RepID=A0A938BPN0_9BACT|nr:dTMP kinase [Candidatus Tanganyikabacteria bacterium]MBM3488102.1 dTMP kinase [Alphaproteobacteria bacterium]